MFSHSMIGTLRRVVLSIDPIVVFLGVGVLIVATTIALALVASAAVTLAFAANALVAYALLAAVRVSTGRLVMSQHSISTASHDQAMVKVRKGFSADLNERLDADDAKADERLASLLAATDRRHQDELATLRSEVVSAVGDVSSKIVGTMTTMRSLRRSLQALRAELEAGMERHSERLSSTNKSIETRLSRVRDDLEHYSLALPEELAAQRPSGRRFAMRYRAHAPS